MSLVELHSRLRLHLKEVHDDRGKRPVYLIEHGLSREELEHTLVEVREALRGAELTSGEWSNRYMPLLVIAAEVGYEFGAEGHEYWPVLEDRLDWEFTHERRHALRDLFRDLRRHTGVEPPDTEWAQNFHLIAWPIAHAVLPKRLHERLLRAILMITKRVERGGDYFDEVREADPEGPLAHFLAQEDLAREVIEGIIIGQEATLVSQPLIDRLRTDVLEAPVNRALARRVKQRQDALQPSRARGARSASRGADPIRVLPITLYIDQVGLEARVAALRTPALQAPGVERARLRALGAGRHYTVSALDNDGCALPSLRGPGGEGSLQPLIAEGDLPADRLAAAHLKGLCVDLRRPLVFVEGAADDIARQASGGTYPAGAWLWVMPEAGAPPPAGASRRLVCGEWIYRCDAQRHGAWLNALGLQKASVARTRLLGAPSLVQPLSTGGVAVRGDQLFIDVDGAPLRGTAGAEEVTLDDGLYAVPTDGAGDHIDLALTDPNGRVAQIHLDLVEARPRRQPLVDVHLEGPPTVGALRAGRLSIRIAAEAPLAGIRLSVRAREIGREAREVRAHTEPLPSLPTVIHGAHELWEHLARDLSGFRSVLLEVDAGALGGERWTLDVEDRSFAWREDEADQVALEGEVASRYDAARPWTPAVGQVEGDLWLNQPLRSSDRGPAPVLGAGVVTRGRRAHVVGTRAVPSPPKQLLRRLEGDERGNVGAQQIVTAWLCWGTSTAHDVLAAAGRRVVAAALDGWTATALCGPLWAEAEASAIPGMVASFGHQIVAALWAAGVCRDPQTDEHLDADSQRDARSELAREVAAVEGWLRRALEDETLREGVAVALDLLAIDAYRRVAQRSGRRELDPDVYSPADEVDAALRGAVAAFDALQAGSALVSLLLPHSAGAGLAEGDFSSRSDPEIVEHLAKVLQARPEGVPWTPASAEILFNVWVHPGRARLAALPDVLGAALEDRGAARMIRYCALRRRAALGMVP